jgi:hypothetical protein
MKKHLVVTFFAALGLFLVSCSDEVKLQNVLTKDGGRWNVDKLSVVVTNSLDPDNNFASEEFNAGEMTFYESNRGVWITYDTTFMTNVAYYFEWENTANTIIVNFEDFPDEETEYTINQVSKEEQIWVNEDQEVVGEATITTTTEITLVKEEEIDNI